MKITKPIRDDCEFCGAPQPCARPACIEALFAQADYHEASKKLTRAVGQALEQAYPWGYCSRQDDEDNQ